MKLILSRTYTSTETQGLMLILDGFKVIYQCLCLELPQLGNQHNISCIPDGTYSVIKYSDTKHPNCFWVQNVPGRTGILVHLGNFATGNHVDTQGCILPGTSFVDIDGNGSLDVVHPDIAMATLNQYLPNSFKITIC
jgi:hypothetical protein